MRPMCIVRCTHWSFRARWWIPIGTIIGSTKGTGRWSKWMWTPLESNQFYGKHWPMASHARCTFGKMWHLALRGLDWIWMHGWKYCTLVLYCSSHVLFRLPTHETWGYVAQQRDSKFYSVLTRVAFFREMWRLALRGHGWINVYYYYSRVLSYTW